MINQDFINISRQLNNQKFVIFSGAGISMGPPSSLPNWWSLNEWILSSLYSRINIEFEIKSDYSRILLDYRNASNSYPPDYQAQYLEECAGLNYFDALTSLEIESTNLCHNSIAALAKAGHLTAIVTTNFDRLIEKALEYRGVNFTVACDRASFNVLFEKISSNESPTLPVIKIHGSTDNIKSLIDTRKQRRRGRTKSLKGILNYLLHNNHFLFTGFSGADFEHDKKYLGIWDAADHSPGFTFLHQPGKLPKQVIYDLNDEYGSKGKIIEIDAAEALNYLAITYGEEPKPSTNENPCISTDELVQGRIDNWAKKLDRWQVVRMAAALQEAASLRVNALRILKKAIQNSDDNTAEYYLTLADYVKSRLRRARYDDIELRHNISILIESQYKLAKYYKFLCDAFLVDPMSGGSSILQECKYFAENFHAILKDYTPTDTVDAILIICQVASIFRELPELIPALRYACNIALNDGDDVRLAIAQSELCVRLAIKHEFVEAESLFNYAMKVANELKEHRIRSTASYALALIREHKGVHNEALGAGKLAYLYAVQDELRFCMSRALLLQFRAAALHGGPSNIDFVRQQINNGFEHEFWAHQLEYQLYEAIYEVRSHNPDGVLNLKSVADGALHAGILWIAKEANQWLNKKN